MTTTTPWAAELIDESLAAEISLGMADVEDKLREAVSSEYALLDQASRHLAMAGGKRIRPLLVLLAGQFGQSAAQSAGQSEAHGRIVTAAVIAELTHLASLYHDDVIDEAEMRRSVVSANARWGNTVAILAGDYLFAQAANISIHLGMEYADLASKASKRLIAGQLRDTVGAMPGQDAMQHYLNVVQDKTAVLFSASCEIGSRVSEAPNDIVQALTEFGELLGIAFQAADDILDVVGGPGFGKAPGGDLREGVASLPVIHARMAATDADARLIELLDSDLSKDPDELNEALTLLRAHCALDHARADLDHYVSASQAALDRLPDIPARESLRRVAQAVATRQI
jgi:heptaprenyl diphosphate synthase